MPGKTWEYFCIIETRSPIHCLWAIICLGVPAQLYKEGRGAPAAFISLHLCRLLGLDWSPIQTLHLSHSLSFLSKPSPTKLYRRVGRSEQTSQQGSYLVLWMEGFIGVTLHLHAPGHPFNKPTTFSSNPRAPHPPE